MVLLKRMANDAVAMQNPPRWKRVKEKGWWLRCEMREGKKTRQEGFAGRHETGGSFCGFCLACEAVVHKRQARKVCSAGSVGEQKRGPGGPCKSGEQAGRTGLDASSML